MTATVVRPEVVRFVGAVRAALDDLAPEEVDELTEGLAADLADAIGDDDVAALGEPAAYAAELRAAAGLPARRADPGPGRLAVVAGLDRRALDGVRGWLDGRPWWPAVRDFLVVLRPFWWVARAWAVWMLVRPVGDAMGHVLPTGAGSALLLALAIVASVQFGRWSLGATQGRRVVIVAVNVLAGICLLGGLSVATAAPEPDDGAAPVASTAGDGSGLWSDGRPVRDVFAYDGQGRLLPVVQLYDQDGRPLDLAEEARTVPGSDQAMDVELTPAVNADGRQLWNVYPVLGASRSAPPFRSVAPVATPAPTPSTAASPGPTPQGTPGRG